MLKVEQILVTLTSLSVWFLPMSISIKISQFCVCNLAICTSSNIMQTTPTIWRETWIMEILYTDKSYLKEHRDKNVLKMWRSAAQKIICSLMKGISCRWSLSNLWFSDVFMGYRKRPVKDLISIIKWVDQKTVSPFVIRHRYVTTYWKYIKEWKQFKLLE